MTRFMTAYERTRLVPIQRPKKEMPVRYAGKVYPLSLRDDGHQCATRLFELLSCTVRVETARRQITFARHNLATSIAHNCEVYAVDDWC